MDFEKTLREIVKCGSDKAAEDLLENIKKEFGSVPLIYRRMARHPEVLLSHLLYKNAITETSTLDPKYIELISLAVGAALNCNHCVEYHMNGALRKGTSHEEIHEVILLAGSLAQAAVLADAYRVIDKDLVFCDASCDLNDDKFKNNTKQ